MAGGIVKEFEKRGLRLPADLPKLHWAPMERKEFQREKFTVTPEEAQSRARKIFEEVGVKSWEMAQLDDSLFLFSNRRGHP